MSVGAQLRLVLCNLFAAHLHHIVKRCTEPNRFDDGRRAGLELVRQFTVGNFVNGNGLNHLPAALVWRHGVEHLRFGVKHTDAGRAIRLVAGENIKIAVEVLDVHAHVHGRLAAINEHGDAARVRQPHNLLDGNQCAQHIRHMRDGDDLGAWRQ